MTQWFVIFYLIANPTIRIDKPIRQADCEHAIHIVAQGFRMQYPAFRRKPEREWANYACYPQYGWQSE